MTILRTIKCDLCEDSHTEIDYGNGFPGWCIIQGISKLDATEDRPMVQEDTQSTFCPVHKELIARYIKKLNED